MSWESQLNECLPSGLIVRQGRCQVFGAFPGRFPPRLSWCCPKRGTLYGMQCSESGEVAHGTYSFALFIPEDAIHKVALQCLSGPVSIDTRFPDPS
jgi:hypothetical protein